MSIKKNSTLMNLFLAMGMESWAWSLRRFHTPVKSTDLVLEVGSGGNPYPRSNVLLDAYESTRERHWVPLTTDRPTVLGFVENLPFKDQSFDFVIASHVLEHSADPERFIAELQRVAKAGYIEVPDAFFERVNPYRDHRLEITCRDDTLMIFKKKGWIHDERVVELYEDRVKKYMTTELMPKRPFEFHVRHFWKDKIRYRVINPEVDATWQTPEQVRPSEGTTLVQRVREWIRMTLRNLLSQRARNQRVDLTSLLRCTSCHADALLKTRDLLECRQCGTSYPIRDGVTAMNEGRKTPTDSVVA